MEESNLNFVCASCSTVNRVPKARIGDGPICASCKATLTTQNGPIELSEGNFQKFISQSDSVVVVDFWAPWCGPCRAMAPNYAEAASELAPTFLLAKLDTDEAPQAASPFKITGIPCLIAFRGGKEIARQAGSMSTEQIVGWVQSVA